MHRLEITRSFNVTANFSPEQWGLHTEDMDCSYIARELNTCLNESVAIHTDRKETEREMLSRLRMYEQAGSNDTKTHDFLEIVLDFIYGKSKDDN